MATGTLITTPFGYETTAAEVVDGRRPHRQARHRHRRRLRHRRRDRPRARRRRRGRHARGARHRGGGPDRRRHQGHDRPRRPRRAARPRRPGLRRRVRRRLDRPAAHPRQQRGRDGRAGARDSRPRAGTCSSPPTTSATSRSPRACTARSRRPSGARVVSVSSAAHLRSPVIFDDLHFAFRPYDPWLAYGQSKTANVLFAVEADRRWADDGIRVNALMPGGIATNLQRHVGPALIENAQQERLPASRRSSRAPRRRCCWPRRRSSRASAAATSRTATRPRSCTAAAPRPARAAWPRTRVDPANAERLWEVSEELVG